MNILLWILQAVLALLCLAGGGFKASKPADLVKVTRVLSEGAWRMIGVLEVLFGVLLIVPAAVNWIPALTPLAAVLVAVENLLLSAVYARISVKLVAANPLVWSVPIALLAAFVAWGRYSV
jgi:hypothetical protein